jgi:hypothetical protein
VLIINHLITFKSHGSILAFLVPDLHRVFMCNGFHDVTRISFKIDVTRISFKIDVTFYL